MVVSMKQKINLGIVCLVRHTFDFKAANEIYKKILTELEIDESIELYPVNEAVIESEEAIKTGKYFAENHVDAIAVLSGTFHLGHLVLEIKKWCDKPVLLWGLPELPYDGGKIRLNSVCGVNLNASNLTKSGHLDYTYTVSDNIDQDFLDAIRMIKVLKEAKVGILGSRAHGFFNVGVSELALYKKYGCLVDSYQLDEVFNYKEDSNRVNYYENKINKTFNTKGITKEQVSKTAILASKIECFINDKGLDILAIRCWPEFAAGFSIAPCAAMSILQDEGYILACEGDIDCGLTMLCHKAIGARTPFMADLSQVNLVEDYALMWHCGVAPSSLCDGICTPTLDTYFAGGKGVTAGFVMKPGKVHVARLDSVNGEYRIFQETGKAIPMEKELSGTYAKCIFDNGLKKVLDKLVYSGTAHHLSMVYGDYTKAFEIFARLTNTEVIV